MINKINITYQKIVDDTYILSKKIDSQKYSSIYAIPRGGVPIAILLSHYLNLPLVEKPIKNSLIVDDLIDSGETINQYISNHDIAVLYRKSHSPLESCNLYIVETLDGWIEFPYEETKKDIQDNFIRIAEYFGLDLSIANLEEDIKNMYNIED